MILVPIEGLYIFILDLNSGSDPKTINLDNFSYGLQIILVIDSGYTFDGIITPMTPIRPGILV